MIDGKFQTGLHNVSSAVSSIQWTLFPIGLHEPIVQVSTTLRPGYFGRPTFGPIRALYFDG